MAVSTDQSRMQGTIVVAVGFDGATVMYVGEGGCVHADCTRALGSEERVQRRCCHHNRPVHCDDPVTSSLLDCAIHSVAAAGEQRVVVMAIVQRRRDI